MIATVNLPGSDHFRYFRGTRAECKEWLGRMVSEYQERFGGTWISAYSPGLLTSNKKAAKWRYRDGSRVIPILEDPQGYRRQALLNYVD